MTILSNPPSYFEQWIQEQDVDGLETLPPYIRRPKAGPSRPGLHKPSPLDFTGHSQEDSNVQLSLTLTGDANLSRQHPCFVQGRPISGTVSLSQHKDAQIRSIYLLVSTVFCHRHILINVLQVRGRFNPHHQPHRGVDFLCVRLNLWSTADAPLSDSDEWPFSIVLPKEVNLVELATGKSEAISLPSSFNEDRVPASIEYDLIVRLDRGAFKRAYWLDFSTSCSLQLSDS